MLGVIRVVSQEVPGEDPVLTSEYVKHFSQVRHKRSLFLDDGITSSDHLPRRALAKHSLPRQALTRTRTAQGLMHGDTNHVDVDPEHLQIISTCKHFAGYDIETGRSGAETTICACFS